MSPRGDLQRDVAGTFYMSGSLSEAGVATSPEALVEVPGPFVRILLLGRVAGGD